MKTVHLLICCILTLWCPTLFAQGGYDERDAKKDWPFGPQERFSRGGDWFNLGLIGAKVDEDGTKDPGAPASGQQSFSGSGDDGNDKGPERPRIRTLFPNGPGERAGLKRGDIILKVNDREFGKQGSLQSIAKALTNAEAKKGSLKLTVEREGEKKSLTIVIKIKKAGSFAAKPTVGKGRRAIVDNALQFLADQQQDDGGFKQTLSGNNGAIIQTCLAGLAWIGGGSDLRSGRYKTNLDKALSFVIRNIDAVSPFGDRPEGANWNQTNWSYVHAAIFLAELHNKSKSPRCKKELERVVAEIIKRQEKSGGWAHGPGGPNALNYLELNIMTALAMSGLGCARRAGAEVSEEAVTKAMNYIEESGKSGGVGYSTANGQKGQGNIGRTAGCWLGAQALGLKRHPHTNKMKSFVQRHVDRVLEGHASLMQHILLAGVAASSLGPKGTNTYWKQMERDLILARSPDGSLQPRPWHESLQMKSNSDVSFGEVWTTAAWAIVLVSDPKENKKGGLPLWTGSK